MALHHVFSLVEPFFLLPAASSPAAVVRRAGRLLRGEPAAAFGNTLLLPPAGDRHQLEQLAKNVQEMLHQRRRTVSAGREMVATVDHLRRLCIDHYFQDEVDGAMAACDELLHRGDLLDATLAFRLLREDGHHVSPDEVFGRFTDDKGEFSLADIKDIRGLLSLQDMCHLNMGEEASLLKAKVFSRKHLQYAIKYLEPNLARYVRQSLDHPYHVSLVQYKARHHLSYLNSLPTRRSTAMEELAHAEFELQKLLHQREMQEIKRWWIELGLTQEIPVARDQVLKWYMWSMTAIPGASYSRYRIALTKIISFVYIVDDIFDLVGTQQELSSFTHAIRMWDISVVDSLPSYMRSCYRAIYIVTNDIAEMAEREHGENPINHLKKAWAMLFEGFMVEVKWLSADQVPASEEYLRNGVVTSGVPLVLVHLLFMLGHDVSTREDASLIEHMSPLISCPAKILRLWDDMGSAKDEAQEGIDGSYKELYLKENPGRADDEAEEHVACLIAREWEELNRECFSYMSRRSTTLSSGFTQASLNFARMVGVMYGYDGEHRGLPVLDEYMRMLLF